MWLFPLATSDTKWRDWRRRRKRWCILSFVRPPENRVLMPVYPHTADGFIGCWYWQRLLSAGQNVSAALISALQNQIPEACQPRHRSDVAVKPTVRDS